MRPPYKQGMRRAQEKSVATIETGSRSNARKSTRERWVPVAIALLGLASVAAEVWGVVRGLALIMGR
jgi:hypothetical protein